jgi:hypothetical protein
MSIARVQTIATIDSAFNTTHTFTVPSSGVTAGNFIIVRVVIPSDTITIVSGADSGGNTYSVDVQANAGGQVTSTATLSAQATTGLTNGQTISVTLSSGTQLAGEASEWSGIVTSGALDKTQSKGPQGFGTAWTSNATATTSQASELLVGAYGTGSGLTNTAGSSFTAESSLTGAFRGLMTEYRIVSATGAYAATGTLSASSDGVATIATYKGASAAANIVNPLSGRGGAAANPLVN